MEKVLSNNSTLVAAIGGLRFGENLIFPIERANTVKVTCSFYGKLWRKRFRTKVNRFARTITVTRVSVADAAGETNENSEKQTKPLKNKSMNTTRKNGAKVPNEAKGNKHRKRVQIDLDELIHECKEHVELLQAVYNALTNTYLRNLEDRYKGDRWFVMCKDTDIITNELGDIISESDDVIAHADGFFAIAAAYSAEVIIRGGTAEKIYVSQ